MPAIGLFRGPMHVMEYANAEMLAVARDGRGMPVSEAYPERVYAGIHADMDECFRTGEIISSPQPRGILIVVPLRDDRGRVEGVGTWFEYAARPSLGGPLPRPRLLDESDLPAHRAG